MLSPIFRRICFEFGQKYFFMLLRPFFGSDFLKFSVPYAHDQHAYQFTVFQKFILCTLSTCVRTWCVHWACTSGTDAYAEHSRQELMRALRIRVRNWCVHGTYVSGTNACTERSPFKTCWAYASGTDAYPEHTGQELMRLLSIWIRYWCVPWAYASVCAYAQHKRKNSKFEKVSSNHADHARKELTRALNRNWCLVPPKIKVTLLYFSPKVTTQ